MRPSRVAIKLELLDRLERRVERLIDRKAARLILANILAARADLLSGFGA